MRKIKENEKIFCLGEKIFYQYQGDFFYASFSLNHPDLKDLNPYSEQMIDKVLCLGRSKAKENGIIVD